MGSERDIPLISPGLGCPRCGCTKTIQRGDSKGDGTRCRDCRNRWKRANRYRWAEKEEKWKKANPKRILSSQLRSKYGITLDEFGAMLAKQSGMCAICSRRERLFVDHNHETGKTRELLCSSCNSAIGLFKDDATLCRHAASYIERHAGEGK